MGPDRGNVAGVGLIRGDVMVRAALIGLALFAAAPAVAAQLRPLGQTDRCLEAGEELRPGFNKVGIAACNDSEAQDARRGRLDTIYLGKACLQAYIVDGQPDVEVMTAPCHGRDGQRWILTRDGRLSSGERRCLTVTGSEEAPRLLMNTCAETPEEMRAQKWAIYGKFE